MDNDERRDAGARAAIAVAADAGWADAEPVILQRANNVVVWLRPHPIVAKVGTWPHSHEHLAREADVCAALAERGAPVGVPVRPEVVIDPATGFPVSLWHRIEVTEGPVDPRSYAEALHAVQIGLDTLDLELPSFLGGLDHARRTLFDDTCMHRVPPADVAFVRDRFDDLDARIRVQPMRQQALHGEPHLGNVLGSAVGPRVIDFEGVCVGPVELDLSCVDAAVVDHFAELAEVDHELLALCRLLSSARVATWCFQLDDLPEMHDHGQVHLALLRASA